MNNENLIFNYDNSSDVLYAFIGKPMPAKNIDLDNGVVLRINPSTEETIGFTIVNYMKRVKRGMFGVIPKFEDVELPTYN